MISSSNGRSRSGSEAVVPFRPRRRSSQAGLTRATGEAQEVVMRTVFGQDACMHEAVGDKNICHKTKPPKQTVPYLVNKNLKPLV